MLLGFLIILAFVVTTAIFLVRWGGRDTTEPPGIIEKVVVTTIMVLIISFSIPVFKYFAPFFVVACGTVLSLVWTPDIATGIFGSAFSTFDGGSERPDQLPQLSAAQTLRRRGEAQAAIEKIREKLEEFPEDYTSQMMIAEIQAEDLGEVNTARYTIEAIVEQAKHGSSQKAAALNSLADWLLSKQRDPVAARIVLERIASLFPNSEVSQRALQRIARLPSVEMLAARDHSPGIEMRRGFSDLGLKPKPLQYVEIDPHDEAAELTRHLEQHPQDFAAREQLAVLHAQKLGRVDLAEAELSRLIHEPHADVKQVVQWVSLLADLQARNGGNLAAARQTLQQIIDRYPNTAFALQAWKQMEYLGMDQRTQKQKPGDEPGSLEDDLKPKRPV